MAIDDTLRRRASDISDTMGSGTSTMTAVRVLGAKSLMSDRVVNVAGESIGKIDEFMIDLTNGCISYAVLSYGGVLGMGDKLFAIPWQAFTVDTDNKQLVLNVSKDMLDNAPGFDKDNWPDMTTDDFHSQIYGYYGYPEGGYQGMHS